MASNIGFISTCFAGTNPVYIEASKWSDVLNKNGHHCFWFAGEVDKLPPAGFLVPEAHVQYAPNKKINAHVFGKNRRAPDITKLIHTMRSLLKTRLYHFIDCFNIDMIIPENALSLPTHIPLALALAEIITETQIPTIAHHHNFYWEHDRFSTNAVGDFLHMAFPPNLSNIRQVVVNPCSKRELAGRTGICATIIPNVLDFDHPPSADPDRYRAIRDAIGINPEDKMILQPTRVIEQKKIEYAVELVKALRDDHLKLVISHEVLAKGDECTDRIKAYASGRGLELRFIETDLRVARSSDIDRPNCYSQDDIYAAADLIIYPNPEEGSGNTFLEAVYFKKPILINRHDTFIEKIEPEQFDLMIADGFLTAETVDQVAKVFNSPAQKEKMVNHNYRTAARHYSYHLLKERLVPLITRLDPASPCPGSVKVHVESSTPMNRGNHPDPP